MHLLPLYSCLLVFFTPRFAGALDFVPLSPDLPIVGSNWYAGGLPGLFNAILVISIALAAILAVVMIAIGGFKYMTSDSVFAISGAKEQIANAIIGLLIVLSAILILETINPCIVQLNLFTPDAGLTGSGC